MSFWSFAKKFNYKVISTAIFALAFAIVLIVLVILSESTADQEITFILCTAGSVLGWLIGIVTTPYGAEDKDKIYNFSKMAGTFISGYLLSKVNKILDDLMEPTKILSYLVGVRFVLFICFFIISYIVVFVFRIYTRADEPPKAEI
jgi:uncharacterized membrane protein